MLRIAVDFDDVLAMHLEKLLRLLSRRTGRHLSMSDITTWNLPDALGVPFETIMACWNEPGFYADVQPLPGALKGMDRLLRAGHDLLIVTASISLETHQQKIQWVQRHLPWFDPRSLSLNHRKEWVAADVLLDDSPENLVRWQGTFPGGVAVAMDKPYNRQLSHLCRVSTWDDFVAIMNNLRPLHRVWQPRE